MPITINGNGAISGLGDIDGHDLETATLVVSGDTTIAPQAVGRASLFVDDSANTVGINTTTPSTLLEVQGKGTKQVLRLTNPSTTDTAIVFNDSTNATGNAVQLGSKSGELQFVTNQIERVRIANDGKIGINTDNPTERVEVRGPVNDSNLFLTTNSTAADSGATIGFQSTTNGWTFPNSHARIKGGRVDGSNGYLEFYTRQGATNTLVMRLHQNGNVGINEAIPTNPLHIVTQNPVIDNGNPSRVLFVEGGSGAAGEGGAIGLGTGDNLNLAQIKASKINGTFNHYAGEMVFSVNTVGGTMIEAARFTTQGNLAFPNGQGIDFSASEGANATLSILDDYEEGIFTTTITDSSGGSLSVSSSNDKLQYVKIGNMVFVSGRPLIDGTGGTGSARISLPFTNANLTQAADRAAGSVDVRLCNSSYDIGLFNLQLNENSNYVTLTYGGSNDTQPSTPALANGTQIWISIFYRTV